MSLTKSQKQVVAVLNRLKLTYHKDDAGCYHAMIPASNGIEMSSLFGHIKGCGYGSSPDKNGMIQIQF